MKPILEYIISKSTQRYVIKATDETLYKIIKGEVERLGQDADLNHIDVSKVENFFYGLDKTGPENIDGLFEDLNFSGDVSGWNMSNAKTMSCMFYKCHLFDCDISQWDVSKCTKMNGLFLECFKFNQDISGWDVSNVESMKYMFYQCKKFNQDISRWKVSKVTNITSIFNECDIKEEYKPKFNI